MSTENKDIAKVTEGLTDDDLQKELKRREVEREKARMAWHDQWSKRFVAMLTKDVIDGFAPEHDRTSCSDDNLANGFGSRMGYGEDYRCARCALLECMRDGYLPYPVRFRVCA